MPARVLPLHREEGTVFPAQSQIVLGTAQLGLSGGPADAFRLLDFFVDSGGRIIDTAAVYSDWVPGETGRSESIIGEWLTTQPAAHSVTISTKGGHPLLSSMGKSRLDPASLRLDVEASLRRLGADILPLYFLHRDDEKLPVAAILEPLARLAKQGKIGGLGVSNWKPARIEEALAADVMPVAGNQVFGNILCAKLAPFADSTLVKVDAEAVRIAEKADQSLFLFSSQCEGYFAKRLSRSDEIKRHYLTSECATAGEQIAELASARRIDPTELALKFLLGFSPRIFPIVGSRTIEQLGATMRAAHDPLDRQTIEELEKISGFCRIA
jgi:aryl-alcohol dehydrogenase-like predicted oxidoreductase